MRPQYAVLLDGGFVTKKLSVKLERFPTAGDIEAECARIASRPELTGYDRLRVYYYDAPPTQGVMINPVDGSKLDLSKTERSKEATSLFQTLELCPDFALRMGETVTHGWELGRRALAAMAKNPRAPTANDFVPNIEQKGVDLRIGLDIARLALRQLVQVIVVVTGDSDLVPAFKFARREGLRVFLDHMGHGVRRDLKVHADRLL
jgi:uncharacterized LabA/DUF88 family protein